MEKEIKNILSKYSGDVGVIIEDSFGRKISINENEVFPSASIIKLFILLALPKNKYSEKIILSDKVKVGGCGILPFIHEGIELTIKDLISLMICLSDNTATNILIDYLGIENINSFIKRNNFNDTILGRKMMDIEAQKSGKDNFTSPNDVLKILNILCEDDEILSILKGQACNNKIPLYLPKDIVLAHKTGELNGIEHDIGRLYINNHWVNIVILTKNLLDNADGIKLNNEIGKFIFDTYSKIKEE